TLAASTVWFVAALVVTIAIMVRLSILPPAIAVEAPGARPAAALEDTKGWALRIFAIFFVAVIPWLAVDLAVTALIGRGITVTGSIRGVVGLVFGGILQTVLLTLIAAIASLLFIALGAHPPLGQARRLDRYCDQTGGARGVTCGTLHIFPSPLEGEG